MTASPLEHQARGEDGQGDRDRVGQRIPDQGPGEHARGKSRQHSHDEQEGLQILFNPMGNQRQREYQQQDDQVSDDDEVHGSTRAEDFHA